MKFDQNDAAGLAWSEKCCLLGEAAERELTNTAPALACERYCSESVLDYRNTYLQVGSTATNVSS